jgi:hypothetical protein
LGRLDADAWEQLVTKALPEVCRKDSLRHWSQFWNYLSEALGYVLLADRGYTKIRFIDQEKGETPDLLGESGVSRGIVEVKTVNPSEVDVRTDRPGPPILLELDHGLSDKLKGKLEKTLDAARAQLRQFGEPADKRIALLVVNLDRTYKFGVQNYSEIKEFVASHQAADVELVHQVIS